MCLSACQNEPEPIQPEPVVMELWHYWDAPAARQRLQILIQEFNKTHSGIEIKAKCIPDEDFKKTLALAIADGNMPDLAIVDSSDVQFYQNMDSLANISDYIDTEQYLKQALVGCITEAGGIVGLPMGINILSMYYNRTLLGEHQLDPPTTMEEFAEAAKRTTGGKVYGCAFPTLQSEETTFSFLPILWANGGSVETIDSEAGEKSFDFIRELSESGAMNHNMVNMTLSDITKEFTGGRLAMAFITSGKEIQIRQDNPELDFFVAPLPLGDKCKTIIGGEVLTVMKQEHEKEAREFVRFIADPECMKTYLQDMSFLAPRKDVLMWQMKEYPEQRKHMGNLQTARTREFTRFWPAESMAIAELINQVILQEDQPESLKELDQKIRRIREEYYEGR